jgi:hypothetical protein
VSPTSTAPDLLTSLKTGWNDAMQQWWDQSQSAFEPWKQAWETVTVGAPGRTAGMSSHHHGARSHRGHESCGCQCCGCQSCEHESREHERHEHERHEPHECESHEFGNRCHCCIPDADVLLHARAGERRVIPFLLRNPWRREREVSLAVGPWQVSNGGRIEVQASFDAGESLTLQPCERRVVRLTVGLSAICDDGKEPAKPPATKDDQHGGQSGCDVESCVSAYADVRFEGCARPQRVGLVVYPAICDAVELPCECGCSSECDCC